LSIASVVSPSSPGLTVVTDYVSAKQFNDLLKIVYITEILFVYVISAVKLSVLYFYRNIFATKSFLQLSNVFVALCLSWLLVMTFLLVFQCHPIHDLWNYPDGLAHCMPTGRLLLGFELSNLLLDVCILCLPIYMVRRLQLSTKKKVMVSALFLLGAFVCVTCIVRLHYLYDPKHPQDTRSQPNVFNWSIIELGFAIISACLPLYGPFFSMVNTIPKFIKSWHSSHKSSSRSSQGYANTIGEGMEDRLKIPKPGSADRNSGTRHLTRFAASGEDYDFAYPMEPLPAKKAKSLVEIV